MERKTEATVTGPGVDQFWERLRQRADCTRWVRSRDREARWAEGVAANKESPCVFESLYRSKLQVHAWFFHDIGAAVTLEEIAPVGGEGNTHIPSVYNGLKRTLCRDILGPLAAGLDVAIDRGIDDDAEEYEEGWTDGDSEAG